MSSKIVDIPEFVKFSKEDIEIIFNKYDPNKTGYIRRDGLKDCLFYYFGVEKGTQESVELVDYVQMLFNLADGNGIFNSTDGKLNIREFTQIISCLPKKYSSPKKSMIRMIFLMIDTNENGFIKRNEFKRFIDKSGLRMNNDEIKKRMNEMDLNDESDNVNDPIVVEVPL